MTYAELGQRTKAKYPQYASLSDEEVGQRVAQKYPQYQSQITEGSGNAITNFVPSLAKNAGDIAQGIGGLAYAGVRNTVPGARNYMPENKTQSGLNSLVRGTVQKAIPGTQGDEATANAVGQFYKDRYGGVQNIKNTVNQDPVGALLDVSTLAGGIGLGARIGGLNKTANFASKVSRATDPLAQAVSASSRLINNPLTRTLEAPFKSQINTSLIDDAKKLGIEKVDLPVSAQSRSPLVQGVEALTEKTIPIAGSKISNKIGKLKEQLRGRALKITEEMATDPDYLTSGNNIISGYRKYRDDFRIKSNELYNEVPQEVMASNAVPSKTIETLNAIAERNRMIDAPGKNTYFDEMLKNYVDEDGQPLPKTIKNIKETRSFIGSRKKDIGIGISHADEASYNQLYDSLTEDLDNSIALVDPEAGVAFKTANDAYREGIAQIESSVGDVVNKNLDNPELIVTQLIKPNSESTVAQVRELIGEEAFSSLQESFIKRVYNKALDSKGEVIDPVKLDRELRRYGAPTLKKLLTPEQLKRLNEVSDELKRIDRVNKGLRNPLSSGSQTAYLIGQLGGAGALFTLNPSFLSTYVYSGVAGHLLSNTRAGNKFLTTGANVVDPLTDLIQKASRQTHNASRTGNTTNDVVEQSAHQQRLDAMKRMLNL